MRTGNQSYWFDGELDGNFSLKDDPSVALGGRDSFDPAKGYLGVRIQQGVPVLDRDWNELEDIRRYQEMILRRYYLGDGTPDDGFKVAAASGSSVSISAGRFLAEGLEVISDAAVSLTLTTPASPPATWTNYVYLEVTIVQVDSSVDPDLGNTEDAGVETCIRHKPSWEVKATENDGDTMPPSTVTVHRSLLATITRNGPTITQDQIADSRARLHLLKTGDLGCQKVDGPLEIGNGAFLVGDLSKTLQIAFLDTAGTALTSPYFDLSADGALLPGPVRIGDTTWPIPAQTVKLLVIGGATIEGGLTANGVSGTTLGLTVNNGAIVYGGLTIADGTLTLGTGVTISGGTIQGGAGSFTKGLTVSNDTPGTGLTVNDGSIINGGLTVNNVAGTGLTVNNGLTVSTGALTVGGLINANGGEFLPPCTLSIVSGGPASFEIMFEENDVSGGDNGGQFAWLAINNILMGHRMSLGFKPDGATNFGEVFYIKSDGSYPASTSDQMYKTNVATLADVLQKIDQIRGVSFDWNDLYRASHYGAPEARQIGMIAQEVQAVFPELVEQVTLQDRTFLGLDYQRFTAVLVQAVKELKAMNEALSDRVKALEAPTKTIAKKVTNSERPA